MLTKVFELGEIDYKLPNIPQAMRLLGKLGLSKEGAGDGYESMAALVEHIGPLVCDVRCKNAAGEPVTTFDGLLGDLSFTRVIMEIATEIMASFNPKAGDAERKNS